MRGAKRSWGAMFVLLMAGVAFALDQAATTSTGTLESLPLGKRLLNGVLGGVIAALIGWAKNRDTKTNTQEAFSFKYFSITVAIGAVVGAIAGALGKTLPDFFNQYESLPIWGMAMMGAEAMLKTVFRQSVGLAQFIGIVKKGSENPPSQPSPNP